MEILKLISANEILAQLICFLTVFFLLRAFLWKSFLKILDERRQRVVNEFQKIEETKTEVSKLKADFESKMNSIDEIAAGKLKEAKILGEELANEIKTRAANDAHKIISDAKTEIENTVTRTKQELKQHVVELTLLATEKMIGEKLTGEEDRRLVSNFVEQLEKKSNG